VKADPQIAAFGPRHQPVGERHPQPVDDPRFYGAMAHDRATVLGADHPAVLVGRDNGPNPAA
jgi:hypothetical protein